MANAKATRIQEAAKAQTFGVEIEMNGITRPKAAKLAAGFFGTGRYEDTAYRNGYCTWTAYDQSGREWNFARDVSIHGADSEKCELVTPILTYEDMPTLQELVRMLRRAGAKSDASRGCGVHIHIGLKAQDGTEHTPKTVKNLLNLMASHEDLITEVVEITDPNRIGHYCKVVSHRFLTEANKLTGQRLTWENLAKAWYGQENFGWEMSQHYSDTRYRMLNLHPTMQWTNGERSHRSHAKPTIEFRAFQFDKPRNGKQNGLHAGQLKAYIDFCLHMSAYAKLASSVSYKVGQRDNKAYGMRTWLLRLGFIGEEYENDRKHLMRNMTGNSAWR